MKLKKTWFFKKSQSSQDMKLKSRSYRAHGDKTPTNDSCPIAVYFVMRTPGGVLADMTRKAETELQGVFRRKVKIVEKPGTKLQDQLTSSDPWGGEKCQRRKCKICDQDEMEGKPKCKTRSVVYSNTCLTCKNDGKKVQYIGETGRSGMERQRNHHQDYRGKDGETKSHMLIHELDAHEGKPDVKWYFKIERRYKSAFLRQLGECILIRCRQQKEAQIVNRKEEYSRSVLPQLEVSIGGRMLTRRTAADIKAKARTQEAEGNNINDIVRSEKRQIDDEENSNRRPRKRIKLDENDKKIQNKRKHIEIE